MFKKFLAVLLAVLTLALCMPAAVSAQSVEADAVVQPDGSSDEFFADLLSDLSYGVTFFNVFKLIAHAISTLSEIGFFNAFSQYMANFFDKVEDFVSGIINQDVQTFALV